MKILVGGWLILMAVIAAWSIINSWRLDEPSPLDGETPREKGFFIMSITWLVATVLMFWAGVITWVMVVEPLIWIFS